MAELKAMERLRNHIHVMESLLLEMVGCLDFQDRDDWMMRITQNWHDAFELLWWIPPHHQHGLGGQVENWIRL
jgi:hypothetical protein